MEPDVEKAWARADRIISRTQSYRNIPVRKNQSSGKWKSLNEKLMDLYIEESVKEQKYKHIRATSRLLKKLVHRDKLNFIVVNLYPGNDGYSLLLKSGSDVYSETLRLPYEESEFLQYIDNRELPPIIIDLLEQSEVNLFHNGCVIVEIRDYRRCSPDFSSEFVLLKPSTHTLISDLNAITSDSQRWTYEDKQLLESSMLLATQEPLCLDPSVAVTFVANRIQHEFNGLNHLLIKKNLKKYSQVAVNRRRKLNQFPAPANLKLHDFIKKRNAKLKLKKATKPPVDTWIVGSVQLSPPPVPIELPAVAVPDKPNSYDTLLSLVEEYVLEAEKKEGKIFTKLSVFRRTLDDVYIGKLYVDRDYVEGQQNGATCEFTLGSKLQVAKYINQFREIFTEEGRKAVKITHVVPGLPSKISFTQGMREKNQNDDLSTDNNGTGKKPPAPSSSSSLIALVSAAEPPKNLAPIKLSKTAPRQQITSSAVANRLRIETSKSSQPVPLPSYSQALSGAMKSTIRSAPFLKKADDGIVIERQKISSMGGGDIIVNHPCQNVNTSMNISSFPQNISLQNIARVPHLQVSLAAMPQGLAVPISIAMVDPAQSGGVIVSSASGSNIIACTAPSSTGLAKQTLSIAPSSSLAQNVMVSSGMVNTQSSIVAPPTNMLSLPVGVTGGLNTQNLTTQLMATGIKGATPGFRTSAGGGLSLLQVSGTQQPIPLFNQVSAPVLGTATKPMMSCTADGMPVQQSLLALTPQQQQLQFALQKQQLQQLQQQLQMQQQAGKPKQQKRTILKPQK